MARLTILLACVVAAFVLFYTGARSPDPAPATTPAQSFSAARAMADIRVIAPVPHPTGSAANAAVRDYLLRRLTTLGLAPQVQRTESHVPQEIDGQPFIFGATVENVIAILPGKDRTLPALALMAHYDSVPGSSGAADDGAGVASALEIVRAIQARGVPERDVMLLLTDGEEAGLLGATAFFAEHPLARHVGFVVNMDTRGGGGRALMFQAGQSSAGAVDLFRRTAVRPQTNSLTALVYRNMPNDTDFTVSDARRIPGLNLAFMGRQFDYHSPSSTLATLDPGAVQSLGEQALGPAMAGAFSRTLPTPGPDPVYGALPGGWIAAYPAWGGWIVLAVAGGLTAIGAVRARRTKALAWRDLWRGMGGGLLLLAGGALMLELTRRATGAPSGWMGYRPLLARFPLFETAMALTALGMAMTVPAAMARGRLRLFGAAAFILAGLGVLVLTNWTGAPFILGLTLVSAALAFIVFGRGASLCGTWTGLLLTGFGVALAAQIAAPTAALVVSWPLTAAALSSALSTAGRDRRPVLLVIVAVITILNFAWIGGLLHSQLQGLDLPALGAIAIWTGAFAAWPLLWPATPDSRLAFAAPAVVIAAGLAIAALLHFTSPWTARYPRADEPLFVVDEDTNTAWRISTTPLDAWTRAILTADGGAIRRRDLPTFWHKVFAGPARPASAAAPSLSLERGVDNAQTLRITPPAGVSDLRLDLRSDVAAGQTLLNGRPIALLGRPGQWTHLIWRGGDPITVTFMPAGPGKLDVRYAQSSPRWPTDARPLPPAPPTVMGFDTAGSTLVVGSPTLRW